MVSQSAGENTSRELHQANEPASLYSDKQNSSDFGLSEKKDKEIWKDFKAGNESAFIFIYEKHFKSLINYGLNFTSDRDLVLDCLQDMFISLREKRATITETDAIKPLLFKIFRRKVNHYLRKQSKNQQIRTETSNNKFGFTLSAEQHIINRQINDEQIELLNRAILALTNTEREAIFHYYFENHSYQQIADIMDYTQVKTARSLVYKAVASLRKIMEPEQKNLFLLLF